MNKDPVLARSCAIATVIQNRCRKAGVSADTTVSAQRAAIKAYLRGVSAARALVYGEAVMRRDSAWPR